MVLKCSLQLDSTHWLVVIDRNYCNGFSPRYRHCCELKVICNFTGTTECESSVQALMTDEEDHGEAVTYPRSQNMTGGKGGPRTLRTCEHFLGTSMYSWVSYALCPGHLFLLVKSFDHVAKWPGFGLCVREVVISSLAHSSFMGSLLRTPDYVFPHIWTPGALWIVNSITEILLTSGSLRARSRFIYFVSLV